MVFQTPTTRVFSDEELRKKPSLENLIEKLDKDSKKEVLIQDLKAENTKATHDQNKEAVQPHTKDTAKKGILFFLLFSIVWVLLFASLCLFGFLAPYDPSATVNFGSYALNTSILTWGTVIFLPVSFLALIGFFAINPPREVPRFSSVSSLVYEVVFVLAGVFGFDVLLTVFAQFWRIPIGASYYLAGALALSYDAVITMLFAYRRIEDERILWEIVRFALVGVVAGVFDFSTTYGTRTIFSASSLPDWAITSLAVTAGFAIGVLVNYLCSVHVVYRATKKNDARTWHGIVLFVALSALGLGIGIGLEWVFYDYLRWEYVAVFAGRTLAVMVWNYLTRKLFLFR